MTHARRAGLVAGVLVGLLAVAGCSGTDDPTRSAPAADGTVTADGQSLAVEDFAALAAEDGVVLLDVRTPAEYASGHLAGATNLDVSSPTFATDAAALDPDGTYAVYCHSGNRSRTAVAALQAAGITAVADLAGGIQAWSGAGREIVTGG